MEHHPIQKHTMVTLTHTHTHTHTHPKHTYNFACNLRQLKLVASRLRIPVPVHPEDKCHLKARELRKILSLNNSKEKGINFNVGFLWIF